MSKRMSKTLAVEIAERTLTVTNPQNRAMAMNAALGRHGFARPAEPPDPEADRDALIAWLLATYSPRA